MPIVAVFQSPTLTREKYAQTVRKLTGGKRSRMESTADWPVEGVLAHVAGQTEKGFRVVDVWKSEDAFRRFGEKLMPTPNAFLWVVDITEETRPIPIANYMIPYDGESKPGSRFGARLEPTSHVTFLCYEGRNLDTITQAESVESLRGLRDDLDALTAALSVLEATDQVAQEREANLPLYRMLVGALRTLAATPSPMVAPAYFWMLLSIEGFHPDLDTCVSCGGNEGLVTLAPETGGAACGACAPQRPGPEGAAALTLVRQVLGGELNAALTCVDGAAVREVERMALRAIEFHLEHRLRSTSVLTSR